MVDDDLAVWHRRCAVEQFNRTWDLIEQSDRSPEDDVEMILAAATSRWHWARIGDAENIATGDWQVAHVASLLGDGKLAAVFAQHHLDIAETEAWTGWRLASAHEGMARARAVIGDATGRDHHVAEAERALEDEDDRESSQVVAEQLATIPGTGRS